VNKRRYALAALCASIAIIASPAAAQKKIKPAESSRPKPTAFDYKPVDDDERGLWMQVDEQELEIRSSKFLIKDQQLNQYIRSVLCKTVGDANCTRVRIYIMRTPQFNASMAPNGMMVIWSGLLLRTRNEAELASVLGHEFGHYERQHSLQAFRDIRKKSDAMTLLSFLPYGVGVIGQVGLVGSFLSFSRDMEKQADLVSIDYLSGAGYDPAAASKIWQNLRTEQDATAAERKKKSKKDDGGGFFGTHPNTEERMVYLADAAKAKPFASYDSNAAEYNQALTSWWPSLIDDQVKSNDFGATEFLLAQLASDGWTSNLLFARGELYRTRGELGDFDKAIGFYREAIAMANNLPENWRGLGLALLRSGKKDEGKRALQTYLSKKPDAVDFAMLAKMAGASE
jgi:beta-barrel assembly-enhancing protease